MKPYGARHKRAKKGDYTPIHGRSCVICYPPQKPTPAKAGAKQARRAAKNELRKYFAA